MKMIDDQDWKILNARLESIERSLDFLRSVFPEMDTKLEPETDYVLYEGSLTDAGLHQSWRAISFHKPVDCVPNVQFHLSCKEIKDD